MTADPKTAHPTPPFDQDRIPASGKTAEMDPKPDHGEEIYKGSGKLEGRAAIITGADSGIGRAVALAFAAQPRKPGRDHRRGMGQDLPHQNLQPVLPLSGRRAAHEARLDEREHLLDQRESPSPQLLAYATTKGAIATFRAGLAQLLAEKGIRVNAVAPGPIWTPLIPSTMP